MLFNLWGPCLRLLTFWVQIGILSASVNDSTAAGDSVTKSKNRWGLPIVSRSLLRFIVESVITGLCTVSSHLDHVDVAGTDCQRGCGGARNNSEAATTTGRRCLARHIIDPSDSMMYTPHSPSEAFALASVLASPQQQQQENQSSPPSRAQSSPACTAFPALALVDLQNRIQDALKKQGPFSFFGGAFSLSLFRFVVGSVWVVIVLDLDC